MNKIAGPGDSECYQITHESGAEVVIACQGGHIISWKTGDGVERLFLSEDAEFSPGKAIRGGVPVIFPQFSDQGPFGRHGFARKSEWTADMESGRMVFETTDSTLGEWPFEFKLGLSVELSADKLVISLSVENVGLKPFSFQGALHTYLKVDDVREASVGGLQNHDFINEVTGKSERDQCRSITFEEEVDRAYLDVGDAAVVLQSGIAEVCLGAENFSDVVVWNPGAEHGIGDLPEDGWREFVCVEAAQIQSPPTLGAGEAWTGSQILHVRS